MARRKKRKGRTTKWRFKYDLLGIRIPRHSTIVKSHTRRTKRGKKTRVKRHVRRV